MYYTDNTHRRFTCLQKYFTDDDIAYWATDSQYTVTSDASRCKRRSIFKMAGAELADVILPDGSKEQRQTTLCCQAVCFVSIAGIAGVLNTMNADLAEDMVTEVQDDCIDFALVRYFSPHPSAYERDTGLRPICPGPLRLNHCLWKFSESPRFRRSMCNRDGTPSRSFVEQGHIFGDTQTERDEIFEKEKCAYFGLLSPKSVERTVHMTPEFVDDTMLLSDTWLETVTLM